MSRGKTQPDHPAIVVSRRAPRIAAEPSLLLKPLAQAIALMLLAGSAEAAAPFSSAWFAAKGAAPAGASAARPGAQLPGTPPPLAQQQRVNQQLQRSLGNLNNTVAAIAAQQAAQAAGRQLAQATPQTLVNGLGEGGLKVDENALTQGWLNAKAPEQSQVDGKTQVRIEQTADKAILNWETFNVGRDTTVQFAQQTDWAVLNRVNDPNARPSQIQGQIQAPGTVMLVNRNGIVFSASSQVNVRNLVAAAATISDEQFSQRGLYVDNNGSQATFSEAAGKIQVERGARLQTHAPANSTTGGGYALLLGSEVSNDGSIVTEKGQATLAAGDTFYIRRGQGTDANRFSTTRGNEVASSLNPDSSAGRVSNSGLIQAAGGDITLTGHEVRQDGVALASTSVDRRGSIHLLNSASDSSGNVSLGDGSVTAILLEDSQALDSQREAARAAVDGVSGNNASGHFDNLSKVIDRSEQSRIEIVSGGTVNFQSGSLTLASGGQVAVSAGQRSLLEQGSAIDVAGALGVKVAMESNTIKINVQGNEQRDAAGNRDKGGLINSDVWVDVRELVQVAAGVNGYAGERWYTAGGLLEVGGYLGTRNHSVGEWMAQGGTLTFTGQDLVTREGSQINLSGGTLDVQDGIIRQSWLRAEDGRLYELSRAPGDILYSGLYKGFEEHSERWGDTRFHYNPLIAPQQRFERGYTIGRDAGSLVVATRSAVLDGELIGQTYQDDRQVKAPQAGLDGYRQQHDARARSAQLVVGNHVPAYLSASKDLAYSLSPTLQQVTLAQGSRGQAATIGLLAPLDESRTGQLLLDSDLLNGFNLGALKVAASEQIQVDGQVQVGEGGQITLYAPQVAVNADLTARGGRMDLGDVLSQRSLERIDDIRLPAVDGQMPGIVVAEGVRLDASGLRSDALSASAQAWRNGGSLSLRSSGDLVLGSGSLLDVSAGVVRQEKHKLLGGKGGDLSLQANANSDSNQGRMQLAGELRGYGNTGAGTLSVQADQVRIGGAPSADSGVHLAQDFFTRGFAHYIIGGDRGLSVAEGSQVKVNRPVQWLDADQVQGDQAPIALAPLYQEDGVKGVLTQRPGASLSLTAGNVRQPQAEREQVVLDIARGAVLSVDPGQALSLNSVAQLNLEGTLNAWGGSVRLMQIKPDTALIGIDERPHQRAIRLGEQALIDVSARAVTAVDSQGRRYGQLADGGSIVIGGEIDHGQGLSEAADLFVVLEQGARLLADGARAQWDIRGQGALDIASAGGSISLASNNGLRLDGQLSAAAGGAGAAGGSLAVALETGLYYKRSLVDELMAPRELVLAQDAGLPGQALRYGQARLDVARIHAGGFDNLSLLSDGVLAFDGSLALNLGQSLRLYAGSLALSEASAADARITLQAPHVLLAGANHKGSDTALRPTIKGGLSQQDSQAQLQVAAQLLEVRDQLTFGARGELTLSQGSLSFDRRGFALTQLRSEGDLRFLGVSPAGQDITLLHSNADMQLLAAQLYPVTGASARVLGTETSTLHIGRTRAETPAVPLSAFGELELSAGTVLQGGVVRAPLGRLLLGDQLKMTHDLQLLPGSISSVSAAGLRMPYGGTVDGLNYFFDGEAVALNGVGGDVRHGLVLGSSAIDVQQGALLDLAGGGELLGAGFVSGRGGSTDARYHPLMQIGTDGRLRLPTLESNPVYAIVPGLATDYAPPAAEAGVPDPVIGQRITLDSGVPGLAAGTYTLMPASYALMPGAFRVELNGLAAAGQQTTSLAMRNGSWTTSASLSVAHTDIRQPLSGQVILTAADTLRRYAQYNETGYAAFAHADAALKGVPRAAIEADGKSLTLELRANNDPTRTLRFAGRADFRPAEGGLAGSAALVGLNAAFEILAPGTQATAGFAGTAVYASELTALKAPRLSVGAQPLVLYGQGGNIVTFSGAARDIHVRSGAELIAGEVFMLTNSVSGGIVIEQGASISTLGQGKTPFDSTSGFFFNPGINSLLAVSNGWLDILPPQPPEVGTLGPGSIYIGTCADTACSGSSRLYSEGSIFAATNNTFSLDDQVRLGTRNLGLSVGRINVGSTQALADAQASGVLGQGLSLNQPVLDRLLRGDSEAGVPALENLILNASDSLNFFGTAELNTLDPVTGVSRLQRLVLGVPAIHGLGQVGDRATIRTDNLVWNGARNPAGAPIAGGAGSGSGVLDLQVRDLEFGYGPGSQPDGTEDMAREILGFALVNINASRQISANHKGSLQVHHQRGEYQSGSGYQYSGGDLHISTPLWTGSAGSSNRISAGGELRVQGTGGAPASGRDGLGAQLSLSAQRLLIDGTFSLPSGMLGLSAVGDLHLGEGARIDLAGRSLAFNDVTKYSAGGELTLRSEQGNISQAAGALIDLSASHNRAGRLNVTALGEQGGRVTLLGQILGAATGSYDAGGTVVPYGQGEVNIRAQQLDDFAGLNQRLNRDQVFGARSFQIKQGDLVVGDELKAGQINVSLDNGHLSVVGTVDASGAQVGSIRLAAGEGLSLAGTARLDAHGSLLRVDSYGAIIDAPNRAQIELNSGQGQLTLASGARFDLRHGTAATAGSGAGQHDGRLLGTLELIAPRLGSDTAGDIAIDARGALEILGARSIAVVGNQRYTDAAPGGTSASGRPYQAIDQDYLDRKHTLSVQFINNLLANGDLLNNRLAGLNNARYAQALHVRPGVEIATVDAQTDLIVQGDLDLSAHRYASLNPLNPQTAVYGSGEVGNLVLRAGGNLEVYGSINDGFMPPDFASGEERMDGRGWLLLPGKQPFDSDLVIPRSGVELAEGTLYPEGSLLNFDLPFADTTLPANLRLPSGLLLAAPLTLPAGTVLEAAVHDGAGNLLYGAGTLLREPVTLAAGTRLDAGTRLPVSVDVQGGTWSKGVALPGGGLTQRGVLALAVGSRLPAGTDVKLAEGVDLIELRPRVDGQQGRNWALAQMLPEGSQSWSMRLVAGSDLDAADSRATRPDTEAGLLRLADGHYVAQQVVIPGNDPGTGMVWDGENMGMEPGTPVAPEDMWACDIPGWCAPAPAKVIWVWDGENMGMEPGTPVAPEDMWACDIPGWCLALPEPERPPRIEVTPKTLMFSVLRTGTGDLELLSAGDWRMDSLYGVYTAGTQAPALLRDGTDPHQLARGQLADGTLLGSTGTAYEAVTESLYRAWYPEQGGHLRIAAGGDLMGNLVTVKMADSGSPLQVPSAAVGNWLWRQGQNEAGTPAAWWINFGTFAQQPNTNATDPWLVGFSGIGTLGGGNLDVRVGGSAGMLQASDKRGQSAERSQGLNLVVAGSGRIGADGSLVQTGGGDLNLRVAGGINPVESVAQSAQSKTDLGGTLVNLRGQLNVEAGSIGLIKHNFGSFGPMHDERESRAFDPYTSTRGEALAGLVLMPGDSAVRLDSRGDLVVQEVGDPGRVPVFNRTPFQGRDGTRYQGNGNSWFSLWQANTSVDLFSAGGDLTPVIAPTASTGVNLSTDGVRIFYPTALRATAANGSLYYGSSARAPGAPGSAFSLMTAPSAKAELQLLAGQSIYAGGYAVSQSGADVASIATPQHPAYFGHDYSSRPQAGNLHGDLANSTYVQPLFTYGLNTFAADSYGAREPVRFYALQGDVVGLRTGEVIDYASGLRLYQGSGPLRVMAGRDIVNAGVPLGTQQQVTASDMHKDHLGNAFTTGNLIIHGNATDVSQVIAGRDIRLSTFNVAGPGQLEVVAGRNLYQSGPGVGQAYQEAGLTSLGLLGGGAAANTGGAAIAVIVGAGQQGPDYQGLLQRYLDPQRLADPAMALSAQPQAVAKVYQAELEQWLAERFAFSGDSAQARAFFDTLAVEQQRIFARQLYFNELREGGREYTAVDGPRTGSYLRGRQAIAALFPSHDVAGNPIRYDGDATLYGGAGIHTNFGGDIQVLTPGGQQVFGIEGTAPPSTAGVITQGQGDIQLYANGSILLGQSRIMTTFGGSILGWSAEGDINAGRGSKTTVVYTPPRRVYDGWGNVGLAPSVPSTGAGIATLNPIAEVAPGDIDLIAPLGTIDAGEAGIRVSGNVNIAALQVVNAANIQVQGDAKGMPVTASVNTGAIASASAAATSATQAAEDVSRQQQAAARQRQPSVITVQVVGFGSERLVPGQDGASLDSRYNRQSPVQVLGAGALDDQARGQLTEEERGNLLL